MNNLKRAAFNITSKLGLLNSHRSLVLAIAEERQVHETILKLVLARVNASTSLLRWAKKEDNQMMKDCICRLYDVSLMYTTVQREFSEQNNALHNNLKQILQYEVALEQLRKRLKDLTEKRERLQKSNIDGKKKLEYTRSSNVSSSPAEEILKMKDEEEDLKTELETQTLKAELFKNTAIKYALNSVCDAHLKLAEKIKLIFTASKKVVDEIKDVPDHVKRQPSSQMQRDKTQIGDVVVQLANDLNINRPISSNMSTPAPIFHVDNRPKSNQVKAINKAELKKTISNPIIHPPIHLPGPTISLSTAGDAEDVFDRDFVIVSNSQPPTGTPPPVPGHRKRSNTSGDVCRSLYEQPSVGLSLVNESSVIKENEYDELGITNYHDNSDDGLCRLYRSASDSNISNTGEYESPWENNYHGKNQLEVKASLAKTLIQQAECEYPDELYQDPAEIFVDTTKNHEYANTRNVEIYSQPVANKTKNAKYDGDINNPKNGKHVGNNNISNNNEIYENLYDDVEYVDNRLIQQAIKSKKEKFVDNNRPVKEPFKSKLDMLDSIMLTKRAPSPKTKPKPKVAKKLSEIKGSPLTKVAPKPKPRPNSTNAVYDTPSTSDNLTRVGGSVREMAAHMSGRIQPANLSAAHMSGRIQPANLIPSMTQAKLKQQEYAVYENTSKT